MPNIIDRNALSGLIPEPVTREIMQGAIRRCMEQIDRA